jgi:UDPglucose 6-dehydrogenase
MTKHAINAFLATSITFTNEIASLCEATGANAKEVEQGLKTEVRIGQRAYVSPGGAFSGGTLARDINFLNDIGKQIDLSIPVLSSVRLSNDEHKKWVRRKLKTHFGSLRGKKISVLGLTYKPGTDTLRRSASVELCNWILLMGGQINVYDPVVKKMPQSWGRNVRICSSAIDTLKNSDALIIGTEWPEFKKINFNFSFPKNRSFPIFDANCFLKSLSDNENIKYYSVGIPVILKDNK